MSLGLYSPNVSPYTLSPDFRSTQGAQNPGRVGTSYDQHNTRGRSTDGLLRRTTTTDDADLRGWRPMLLEFQDTPLGQNQLSGQQRGPYRGTQSSNPSACDRHRKETASSQGMELGERPTTISGLATAAWRRERRKPLFLPFRHLLL